MKKILLAIAITLLVSPVSYARYRTGGGYANEGHIEQQRRPQSYQQPRTQYYRRSGRRYYPQQPRYYQEPAVTTAPQRFFRD